MMTNNAIQQMAQSVSRLIFRVISPRNKLFFFNTLTNKKEEFTLPSRAHKVRMYNCGPTVYDRQHIGNLSAAVFADVLRRTLEHNGYKVQQVINITDFGHLVSDADDGEDKMTKGMQRDGLPLTMQNMRDFATKYMNLYFTDSVAVGIPVKKIIYPRASDYVPAMIAIAQTLEEKGYAYETSDGLYFDTSRFPSYGVLGNIAIESLKEGARISTNEEKHNHQDFALWKKSINGIGWQSPWGLGFPGWHLECSSMINSILGKQIDIHTGGIEHIAIHHNNEIAQSEAATGKYPFSRFWMHRAHILMNDTKIAKSLGNTAYVSDVIDRGIDPLALRYWFLTSHYRKSSNFTWQSLESSNTALSKLRAKMSSVAGEPAVSTPRAFVSAFTKRMNDDLDTPNAIALLWNAVKSKYSGAEIKAILLYANSWLGFGLDSPNTSEYNNKTLKISSLPPHVQDIIAKRNVARNAKDWALSDKLRDEILAEGYQITDNSAGITTCVTKIA